ncbi:hypothetical protein KKE26_12600 [bacterium]|nr:hypothetical protein [bacterium]MBU1753510.1 hypothetical protein [bacterium]
MYSSKPLSRQKGIALALTLFFLLILVMGGSIFFITSQTEIKHNSSYERRLEALSIAESAAERAIWRLRSADWSCQSEWDHNFGGDTKMSPIKIATGQYMRVSYPEKIFSGKDENGNAYANLKVIASGIVGQEQNGEVIPVCTKQIEIIVRVGRTVENKTPEVFDYAYFINNWGWWYYAGGEQCPGSMRSNGRFDLKKIYGSSSPWRPSGALKVNGSIEAHLDVDYHNYPPDGLAGLKNPSPNYENSPYKKSNLEKETIPNLQDMDYYKRIAEGYNPDTKTYDHAKGKINIGDKVFVDDGVFGDDESHENLILIGTQEDPVEIHDAVVIEGNLIIKGYVKTYGKTTNKPYASVYVGRNMYIADDIQYVDEPDWSTYPQWQKSTPGTDYKDPANNTFNIKDNDDGLPFDKDRPMMKGTMMDNWGGTQSVNSTKNLLAVAAAGGLVYGNYSSSNWYSERYLFGMGNEDVGADGIPDTNVWVDGHWTDPTEGDGIFQKESEDLDGDGEFRNTDYNWKDVTTTGGNRKNSAPLQNFDGLRENGKDSGPLWDPMNKIKINHYSQTATNMISTVDGVYYTQHFLAGRVANSPKFRGSLISKDEAIVYSGTLQLIQDTRYHSNYREGDPNFPIYLFPPGSLPEDEESEVLGTFQKVVNWREK